eukprot:CAMPEP_0169175226 /NCGR_PEP_ID=MMETSP1015-20121227/65065_1 /TAXON_ID=342587 /ORGANISM="Karlodinium micrum, Strain CCMP2283" /LENGTH=191 /DNA_ID=CAMNT_0009249335 /DNA_START=185 /DNA_END=761 /DNA_ORIENTATION=-
MSRKFSVVEDFVGETSCDSPVGRNKVPTLLLSENEVLNLSDLEYNKHSPHRLDDNTHSRRWVAAPSSVCEGDCDDEPDILREEDNVVCATRLHSPPSCPAIKIESPLKMGPSFEQPDAPPQLQAAWGCSKEMANPESRRRLPARLPPLSVTASKSLRLLGSKTDSSPVVEILDLPELSLPVKSLEHDVWKL